MLQNIYYATIIYYIIQYTFIYYIIIYFILTDNKVIAVQYTTTIDEERINYGNSS